MGRDRVEVPERANIEEVVAQEHIEGSNSRSAALEATATSVALASSPSVKSRLPTGGASLLGH